jgi:diphthine synthase
MSLTLIGLGLSDEKDMSLRGLEEAKKSDKIYIELYTNKWRGSLSNLIQIIGKDVTELKRGDLEENSRRILDDAKNQDISILVPGDPLVATTHTSLISDARKTGIKTRVIHNSSIISAVAETGLHIYKFGPTVTIPFPQKTKGNAPESIFDTIKENREHGVHTLCLLDIIAEENRFMTINEGLSILSSMLDAKDKIVAFAEAGSDSTIIYDSMENLLKRDVKEIPAVIIIPGKLHFTEKEFLESQAAA